MCGVTLMSNPGMADIQNMQQLPELGHQSIKDVHISIA